MFILFALYYIMIVTLYCKQLGMGHPFWFVKNPIHYFVWRLPSYWKLLMWLQDMKKNLLGIFIEEYVKVTPFRIYYETCKTYHLFQPSPHQRVWHTEPIHGPFLQGGLGRMHATATCPNSLRADLASFINSSGILFAVSRYSGWGDLALQ